MSEPTSHVYQDIPNNRLQAKQLTNVSSLDGWFTVVAVLIMVSTAVWLYKVTGESNTPTFYVLGEMIFYAALMVRLRDGFGRLYDEIATGMWMAIKIPLLGGILWQAEDTGRWFTRWLRDRNGKRPTLPFDFGVIEAVIDGQVRRVAMIREIDRPYDHVYIAVRGGSFATHSPSRQSQLVNSLAEIANRTVAQANLKLGISYLGVVGPSDETDLEGFLGANLNPLIAHPDLFDVPDEGTRRWLESARESLNELRPAARAFGASRRFSVIEIVVKRNRKQWKQAQRGKLTDDQLYELPIVELSTNMAASLRSNSLFEFDEVKVMGLADLAEFVRCARDVSSIQDYYRARRAGSIPSSDEEIAAYIEQYGVAGLKEHLQCWPQNSIEIDRAGKWLRIDNTYFAALRISQLPKRARPDQLLALQHRTPTNVWLRSAIVGQSVSGATETRNLIVQSSFVTNFNNAFFSGRVVEDPRRRRRKHELEYQTESASAHTIAQFFNIVYVVAASSARDALKQRSELRADLLGTGFVADEVNEASRVQNVVLSGIYGINRI